MPDFGFAKKAPGAAAGKGRFRRERKIPNPTRTESSAPGGCKWLPILLTLLWLAACAGHPVEPPPPDAVPPPLYLPTIRFVIQVGAFSTPERASRFADELIGNGLDAYYFIDDDRLFKVRFGSFDTKADALGHAESLKTRGLIEEFYIVRTDALRMGPRQSLQAGLVATARRFVGTPYQ